MSKKEPMFNPKDLVDRTIKARAPKSWNALKESEKDYICDTVEVMMNTPGVSVYRVSDALIEELSLNIHQHTMVRILKGLLNDKT